MIKLNYKHILEVHNEYDIFLVDLWGVIIEGNATYPGVTDSINQLIQKNKKVFFVTNAPRNTNYLLGVITSWGINATPEMIISSGEVAIEMILNSEEKFGIQTPLIYHLGVKNNNLLELPSIQTTTNIHDANLVVLTLSWNEGEINLDSFDDVIQNIIKRKILTICANPDMGIMQQNVYRYCAGYVAEKIKQLGGHVTYAGKPYTEIYQKVLKQLPDVPKQRILMIGDTFYTDILGANQMGIHSALVLTGNSSKFHQAYASLEEKLLHIRLSAIEHQVMPNLVIDLQSK